MHSTLMVHDMEDQYFHSVVVLPAGTYILGGHDNKFTSEFLPAEDTESGVYISPKMNISA